MTAFLLKLVLAHILGDFVFQTDKMVQEKRRRKHRSGYLYLHIGIHAFALLVLLQFHSQYWIGVAGILVSHWIIDLLKLHLEGKMSSGRAFAVDQLAHIIVILTVVFSYYSFSLEIDWLFSPEFLLFLVALFLVSFVASVVMKVLMSSWKITEDSAGDSLPRAGKYIGILERLFVFGFILLQQWQAIGLLIAAKSIFRFSDLSRAKDRKLTEYVLIGTLLSFGMAFTVGVGYVFLLRLF